MENLEYLFNFFYTQMEHGQNKTNEKEHENEIQFFTTEPSLYTLREWHYYNDQHIAAQKKSKYEKRMNTKNDLFRSN